MLNNSIIVESFTKKYSNKIACNKINFTAKQNSIVGLLGPNGAGKTTLLKTISGIIYPTIGYISVYNFTSIEQIRKITGYVPETPELENNLTVKETLCLQSSLYSKTNKNEIINNAIKLCGLQEVLSSYIKNLSKGYKQRVSLAKALCINPKVLILDEFFSGLDPSQIVELKNKIKQLSKNTTIIFSTHNLQEAISLCNDFYILDKGNIATHGTKESIIANTDSKSFEEAFFKIIDSKKTKEENNE